LLPSLRFGGVLVSFQMIISFLCWQSALAAPVVAALTAVAQSVSAVSAVTDSGRLALPARTPG